MTDLSKKTNAEIKQWIQNYEKNKATDQTFYKLLLDENNRRQQVNSELSLDVTLNHLVQVAINQSYTTYGTIAEINGASWQKSRHKMMNAGGHLDQAMQECLAKGYPLLPALCVNKNNIQTGTLDPVALKGFTDAARRMSIPVFDERLFHKESIAACHSWGRKQALHIKHE